MIKKKIKHKILRFLPFPRIFYHGKRNANSIMVTFDDGPRPDITDKLLKQLDDVNLKASFFLLGEAVYNYPELARNIHRAGHSVSSHGFAHLDARKVTTYRLIEDIRAADKVFNEVLGFTPKYLRPPMGVLNFKMLVAAIYCNKRLVYWTKDAQDYWAENISTTIDCEKVQSGDIILLHEHLPTIEQLPCIIRCLRKSGFNFGAIGELERIS